MYLRNMHHIFFSWKLLLCLVKVSEKSSRLPTRRPSWTVSSSRTGSIPLLLPGLGGFPKLGSKFPIFDNFFHSFVPRYLLRRTVKPSYMFQIGNLYSLLSPWLIWFLFLQAISISRTELILYYFGFPKLGNKFPVFAIPGNNNSFFYWHFAFHMFSKFYFNGNKQLIVNILNE